MKIVVVSDLHLDVSTAGLPRFDDVEQALQRAAKHAIDIEADAFICAGDVCDPDARELVRCQVACMTIVDLLSTRGIDSYWLAGNHDVLEDGHGTTVIDPFGFCLHAVAITTPTDRCIQNRRIGFLPYSSSSRSYDPAQVVRSWRTQQLKLDAIVGHLMLEGIAVGSETDDFPRGRDLFWPLDALRECYPDALLIAGHYHARQQYRGVQVVGSLLPLTRGEINNQAGFLTFEI